MGVVSNVPPRTLDDRIKAVAKVAKERQVDFELWYNCKTGQWGSNWNNVYRDNVNDLLDLLEEDLRDFNKDNVVREEEPPVIPEEPQYQGWKL